jgi:periplasmic divalent cation tolerance protein
VSAASPARVVWISHPSRGARAFARELVRRRLAACVHCVPVASIYRWKGRVEESREVELVVKTSAARLSALGKYVRAAHPYAVPEFVVLVPRAVAPSYLAWLRAETRGGP